MITMSRAVYWRALRAIAAIASVGLLIGCSGAGEEALSASPTVKAAKPGGAGAPGAPSAELACQLPESDAPAIGIASNFAPGYWWDHADLTIAVQAHPNSDPAIVEAIHGAIETWRVLLATCFDGRITLTDVTDARGRQIRGTDIIVRYVPRAGGNVWNGFTVCGDHDCRNVLVKSEYPLPMGIEIPPFAIGFVAMHEIGHALGLGHATNLWDSNDLMGYGWVLAQQPPVVSRCDMEALGFVFGWLLDDADPHPPGAGPYEC